MLKKKNILAKMFLFVFSLTAFCCGISFNFGTKHTFQLASAVVDDCPPDLSVLEPLGGGSGINWTYENDIDNDLETLTLSGVEWAGTLEVPAGCNIVVHGDNYIVADVGSAIILAGATTISGTGSLTLTTEGNGDVISGTLTLGENMEIKEGALKSKSIKIEASALPSTVITGQDDSINYTGETYSLLNMFAFDENAGDVSFEIVEEGSTANGEINGDKLTITRCGELNIKATATGNADYSGATLTQKLTIARLSLVAGTEENQTHIFILDSVDDEGKEIQATRWIEGESHNKPEVRNNLGNGTVTITYWLDENYTIPTTTEHGATEENGEPTLMGKYYIKAVVAESDLFEGITVYSAISIKRYINCTFNANAKLDITYKDLDNNSCFDINSLFVFGEGVSNYIETVIYHLSNNGEIERVLGSNYFEILGVSDSENGDRYYLGITIIPKEDSLYVSRGLTSPVTIKKVKIDEEKITVSSKTYDEESCEGNVSIGDNPLNSEVSIAYYLDENLENPVLENGGIPISAGIYYVRVCIEETAFSLGCDLVKEFSINNVVVDIKWSDNNFVYNGLVQTIEAYYLDLNGEVVALNVSVDKEFKDVQVLGENYNYTASASFANGETNYGLPQEATKIYQIKPITFVANILPRTQPYGTNKDIATFLKLDAESNKKIVSGEKPYRLSVVLEGVPVEINSETAVGVYDIVGECIDSNYNITFETGVYRVNNKIYGGYTGNKLIQNWVTGEEPGEPSATNPAGKNIVYTFYEGSIDDYESQGKTIDDMQPCAQPTTKPGIYTILARVEIGEGEDSAYSAEKTQVFMIDKIEIPVPFEYPEGSYTYDGTRQTYRFSSSIYSEYFTALDYSFIDAGEYKIKLRIKDEYFEYHRWPNGNQEYIIDFVINKKKIDIPSADGRTFKYNGREWTYAITPSDNYTIYYNKQTEVGRYDVVVKLNDSKNYSWSDNSTNNLVYSFVINKNEISNPVVVDSSGNSLTTKDAVVINIGGGGLSPETGLEVKVLNADDDISDIKTKLSSVLKKYDKIFKITDVSLLDNGQVVQPANNITLKLLVPEELIGAKFRLYHIHVDENGKEQVSEIKYENMTEKEYIFFSTNKLSEFVFVYEQEPLVAEIVTFSVLSSVMLILLVVQFILFFTKRKSKSKILASAVPVFYVMSELVSSIVLGCLFGVLLIANIVMLVLNIRLFKSKNNKTKQVENKPKTARKTKAK